MFKFHGYSGPCPKPPLPREAPEDQSLKVEVAGDRLVISIGIRCFANAIEWAPGFVKHNEATLEFDRPKVTDPAKFAEAVADALRDEEEDGTTRVHRMLDAAAEEAVNQGADGIEIP